MEENADPGEQEALWNSLFALPSEPIMIGNPSASADERRSRRVSSRLAGETVTSNGPRAGAAGGTREEAVE